VRLLISISLGCFAIGGLLLLIAGRKINSAERRARWVKYSVYFVIVMIIFSAAQLGRVWLQGILAVIIAVGAFEIRGALRLVRPASKILAIRIWAIYGVIAAAGWCSLCELAANTVAYVYIVVAGFDGFSQVSGQLLGQHKLAPRVSPGKTVEGVAGGMIGALATAALARRVIGLAPLAALQVSLLICVAGLAGDLGASWLKRRAGIKDYGRVLPQHGGVLDRFDSFLPALGMAGLWFHFQSGQV
jgi:phosphatidate cytidylyltransferase